MPNLDEIQTFQQRHFMSSSLEHPAAQVGFILTTSQHYCVVIFDYCKQRAHILGRHTIISDTAPGISLQSNWEEWQGPEYWKRVAMLHNWPHGDVSAVHVYEDPRFRLPQKIDCDCGPVSSSILEHFLENGLAYHLDGSLQRPTIPCGHTTRLRMFEMVKLSCRREWSHYLYLGSHLPDDWDPTDHISREIVDKRLEESIQRQNNQAIITKLATMLYNCPDCCSTSLSQDPNETQNDNSLDSDPEDTNPITNLAHSNKMSQNLKQLLDFHSLTATHLRDTSTMPSRWLPFDAGFDQYWGGPTLESMRPIMDAGQIWSSSRNAWISALGSAMLFRDYGFRLFPSFYQMFWLGPPVDPLDHMMTVGVSDTYDPSQQVSFWRSKSYGLSRSSLFADKRVVVPSDVRIMGASEMLLDAQRLASHNTGVYESLFVYGADPIGSQRIILDLELDLQFPRKITISVDIDSYIWVTHDFRPALSMGIYLAPVIDQQVPIHKHNHIYVDILMPQSTEDQGLDGTQREEWWTKSIPLSSIPHVPFGVLSTANHTSNLLLCFPRMIHNRVNSSRRATRIPLDVIDLFWNEVVLPSISLEAPTSSLPYVDTTVHEIRYKSRKGGSSRRPKAIPFSQVAFKKIQKHMRTLVDQSPMLASYGSFFFVLEGKGIKLWTKDGQDGRYTSPYEALKANFSNLDWDYMMDRTHGELYLDVGASFNPTGNFVGLWRLDALQASFQEGGFKKGTTHHTGTLGRYGGIQAEMTLKHAYHSQICFRSAYQLCYEAIRPNNNEPKFVSDKDAYNLTEGYLKECQWIHEIYNGGPSHRGYGCRDEYRMSGQAALEVLPQLKERAEAFLKSQPILWISSHVWFGLMDSRLEGLRRAQKTLKTENPPNYGTKTSILCHLLRCLNSTPIVMDPHLCQSLKSLDVERVCDRDGMLFLYDLDNQIIPEDSADVRKTMGANVKSRRKTLALPNPITDSDDWPIGPEPSWKDVVKMIEQHPQLLMRHWIYDSIWDPGDSDVGLLFVQFTREFWLQLGRTQTTNEFADAVTTNNRICDTLEEAMTCWSLDRVNKWIISIKFQACSAGLEGDKPGHPHLSFVQRRTTFFPDRDAAPLQSSKWKTYWTEGYISQYHELCSQLSEAQWQHLQDRLDILFANIQCLPDANKPTAKSPGSTWTLACDQDSIKIVTNPCFYRIQKVGGQKRTIKRPAVIKRAQDFRAEVMRMQGRDPRRNQPEHPRKAHIDRRSAKVKRARKPPTRQIKVGSNHSIY
ncbi:uncharacterized protein HD556DRAFT_1238096 [Suillus plorans]|uniref:Uncharacterized protein n=1 Tax=Suillus plorans TaxID=116603 RepID=A0A9P7ANX2_9AGAM|nr:uncharacterized protein HD556DRAFT_1238096 [Suillus plorans]KAG1793366.1 hypothetical protein HD556DRAFT_1238096 [Suillus plorans]